MSKNPQIGTCPCPFKDCKEAMAVRRFTSAATSDEKRRKGGKLYADCPTHGRIGFDGIAGTQEYLLNSGDLWDAKKLQENADGKSTQETAPQRSPAPPRAPTPQRSPALAAVKTTTAASTQLPQKRGILDF